MELAARILEPDDKGFGRKARKHLPDRTGLENLAGSRPKMVFDMKIAAETKAVASGYAARIPQQRVLMRINLPIFVISHGDAA